MYFTKSLKENKSSEKIFLSFIQIQKQIILYFHINSKPEDDTE